MANKEGNHRVYRFRKLRQFFLFAVISVTVTVGAARDPRPIRAEPESLERATPELIERLRADPYDYFRFVNRSWIARVCDVFYLIDAIRR